MEGWRSGSEAASVFQPGMKSQHVNLAARARAERPSEDKQYQNPAPSMDESKQLARKVMNDREMKLELASKAVGRGCPAMWVAK